jgi:hypothetical protein
MGFLSKLFASFAIAFGLLASFVILAGSLASPDSILSELGTRRGEIIESILVVTGAWCMAGAARRAFAGGPVRGPLIAGAASFLCYAAFTFSSSWGACLGLGGLAAALILAKKSGD